MQTQEKDDKKESGHSKRPGGISDKITHPENVLLTGKWWGGWGWLAQKIVPTLSSQPWRRSHLLHTGMETGTAVLQAPASPGSVRTPTLRGWTPILLQPRREAETQAACLTVHLSASTPVGTSVSSHSSVVLSDVLRGSWEGSSVSLLFRILLSWLFLKVFLLPFFSLCVQVVQSVPVTTSISSSLLSLSACLSVTTSSPGVNFVVTSFPSSLSSLSLCPFLSHRLSPPNTVTLSPTLSPSLYISLALSVSLSLPIVEGAHELWMSHPHWPTI